MEKLKDRRLATDERPTTNGGFTLIEVLIVVVIIGVLAALVIPRMLAQTERAKMAEAFQILGALRRAEQMYMATTGAATYLGTGNWGSYASGFATLGVQIPGNKTFDYQCETSPDACYAYHKPTSASKWTSGVDSIIIKR